VRPADGVSAPVSNHFVGFALEVDAADVSRAHIARIGSDHRAAGDRFPHARAQVGQCGA